MQKKQKAHKISHGNSTKASKTYKLLRNTEKEKCDNTLPRPDKDSMCTHLVFFSSSLYFHTLNHFVLPPFFVSSIKLGAVLWANLNMFLIEKLPIDITVCLVSILPYFVFTVFIIIAVFYSLCILFCCKKFLWYLENLRFLL